jgi:endonuclease-3
MTILAARDSDRRINDKAPELFKAFPDMKSLSKATEEDLLPLVEGIVNYRNKTKWLIKLAQTVKGNKHIPLTLDEMTKLPGIGRKSANVIKHAAHALPEGVIVDLHVVRVAPRLGIVSGTHPEKIENQLMEIIPQKDWGNAGMSLSFLGREICRPQKPKCAECMMNKVCEYYLGRKKTN